MGDSDEERDPNVQPVASTPPTPDAEPGFDDRRAAPRVKMEVEVDFQTDSNFYAGFTEDISEGGVFIATYELKPLGTTIELDLLLNERKVHVTGEVRWVREVRADGHGVRPGMGLQFRDLDPADREAISAFLHARAPMFYDD